MGNFLFIAALPSASQPNATVTKISVNDTTTGWWLRKKCREGKRIHSLLFGCLGMQYDPVTNTLVGFNSKGSIVQVNITTGGTIEIYR